MPSRRRRRGRRRGRRRISRRDASAPLPLRGELDHEHVLGLVDGDVHDAVLLVGPAVGVQDLVLRGAQLDEVDDGRLDRKSVV